MERELGVIGRLIALGVADNLLPLLWERPDGSRCGHVLASPGDRPAYVDTVCESGATGRG